MKVCSEYGCWKSNKMGVDKKIASVVDDIIVFDVLH